MHCAGSAKFANECALKGVHVKSRPSFNQNQISSETGRVGRNVTGKCISGYSFIETKKLRPEIPCITFVTFLRSSFYGAP